MSDGHGITFLKLFRNMDAETCREAGITNACAARSRYWEKDALPEKHVLQVG
jgi:hypothetical protein